MVTDLRQALQDVVDDAPTHDLDLTSVVADGTRRVRRRRARVVGGVALAAAVVTTAVAFPQLAERRERVERPEPAAPVVLDPDAARVVEPGVLVSRRTTWRDDPAAELDHDMFLGLTDDGLVLRSRYTYDGDISEFGLTDPATGETSWLPRPPGDLGEPDPLELGVDELVLLDNRHVGRRAVLRFDRGEATWSRSVVTFVPHEVAHVGHVPGPYAWAHDAQLYVVDAETWRWWTAPADQDAPAEPRPDLEGLDLAWNGDTVATGHKDASVTVAGPDATEPARIDPPDGCSVAPHDSSRYPAGPRALVDFAGDRPVATYLCRGGFWTVVYEPDGRPYVAVEPGTGLVRASGERYLVLNDSESTYLLDLDRRDLLRIDIAPHEDQIDVAGDLVLWNTPGPIDDRDVYDVVWRVARFD